VKEGADEQSAKDFDNGDEQDLDNEDNATYNLS
jgi:hypothetical protein